MMFYTIVCGWMVLYFAKFATGTISGLDPAGVDAAFDGMLADPVTLCTATALVVVLAFFILSMGLQGGVERVTKGMMLLPSTSSRTSIGSCTRRAAPRASARRR